MAERKKFRFDLRESREEIAKLKKKVRNITIKDFEEAATRERQVWERAFLSGVVNLLVLVAGAGAVQNDGRPDDAENPEKAEIGRKLSELEKEARLDMEDAEEDARNSGCMGSDYMRKPRREQEMIKKLRGCFE